MKTFQELLNAGWGSRYLSPMTERCPGCGTGELMIVEDRMRPPTVGTLDWSAGAPNTQSEASPSNLFTQPPCASTTSTTIPKNRLSQRTTSSGG